MPRTIPSYEPRAAVAGDSWEWNRSDFSDYPQASGWELTYHLTGPATWTSGAHSPTFVDGEWQARLAPAETAGLYAGRYELVGYVSDGVDRFLAYSGTLTVHPNLATADVGESYDERLLRAIEAKLEGRVSDDRERFAIEGIAIDRIPIAELRRWRGIVAGRIRLSRGELPGYRTTFR